MRRVARWKNSCHTAVARRQRHFLFPSLTGKDPENTENVVACDIDRDHLPTRTHARTHARTHCYIFFFIITYFTLAFHFLIVLCSLTYWFLLFLFLSSNTSLSGWGVGLPPPPPSSDEVLERVELYLYSP